MVRKLTEKNIKLHNSENTLKKNERVKLGQNFFHVRGAPSKIVSKVSEKNHNLKNSSDSNNHKHKIKKSLHSKKNERVKLGQNLFHVRAASSKIVSKVSEKNNYLKNSPDPNNHKQHKIKKSLHSKKNEREEFRQNHFHVRAAPSKVVSKVPEKNNKLKNSPDPNNPKQDNIQKLLRSRTERAGINFPVGRVHRLLRHGYFGTGLASEVPVFIGAVLEYLCAELLNISGQFAKRSASRRIGPRHIIFAVRSNSGLCELLSKVTIPDKTHILSQRHSHLTLLKGEQIPIRIFF